MTNENKHDDQDPINRAFSRIERLQEKIASDTERLLDKKIASDNESQKITNKLQTRTTIGGYLALVVTLGVGAAGIAADAYLKNQDRDDQTLRQAGQRKMEIIAKVSNAITAMRELQERTRLYCAYHTTALDRINNKDERLKRAFAILEAVRPTVHFFNDDFRTLLLNFLKWEESIPDYCDKNAPPESEWRKKQKEIEDQMILSPVEIFSDN